MIRSTFLSLHLVLLATACLLFSPALVTAQKIEGKPAAKKPPANPLEKVVNQIFGKKKPAVPIQNKPVNGQDSIEADFQKDAIDQRVPIIREHQSLLGSARTRIKHKQYSEALEILQNLLNQNQESVIQERDGQYRSLRWVSHREIATLPKSALQLYEKTYGPLAQKMLENAHRESRFSDIRNVARQYFHTQAGYDAANRIASFHVDQGEFAIAARWYRRLETTEARFVTDAVWQLKVGEVYKQTGLTESKLASDDALSAEQLEELKKRLPNQSVEEIRGQWKQYAHVFNPPLKDWLYPGGSLRRSGLAAGSVPLLLSHWQQPITDHPKIRSMIEQLLEDLGIANLPAIPMMQPITVGDRVVIRTLSGLKAIDINTGQTLWESHERVSPAKLLTGVSNPQQQNKYSQNNIRIGINRGVMTQYGNTQAISSPLTNLLFRNSVHGTISSDGKRAFVIDRNAVLSASRYNAYSSYSLSNNDPFRRDWSSNRLAAYDLDTGKLSWSVGGPFMNEPIDPPLAGTFFFGPPLTDDGELFLVGEKENALRVFCLKAETGQVLWSQLLAYTDAPIDRDMARRWWASQAAISEGVLICPTHVGLLVGIDRQSHETLWISRYTKKQHMQASNIRRRPGHSVSNPGTIKDRWFASPPMISGQTIIYAPMEEPILVGYRLADGKELWRIPGLEKGLYPIGIHNSVVIIASEDALTGYDIATGKQTWKAVLAQFDPVKKFPPSVPCGRGLIVGNQIMLPVAQKEIWFFDLDQEKFVSRSRVADPDLQLGNLVMAQGKLISAAPNSVSLFQPKKNVEEKIASRLKENPQDAWALLKKTQILVLDQQFKQGVAELARIDAGTLEDSQKAQYRKQMFECLVGMVRGHQLEFDEQFELIPKYIASDADRQLYLRLKADRMVARKDYAGAFEAYAALTEFQKQSPLLRDLTDLSLSYRQDVWLNSQLKNLWQNSSGEVASQIITSVQKAVQLAIESKNLKKMLHVVKVYGFHPDIEPIYIKMVELAIQQKDYATAEFALNTMSQLEDESVVAFATVQRAELLYQFGLHSDAVHYLETLNDKDPELVLLDGSTIGEWLSEKKQQGWLKNAGQNAGSQSWINEKFEMARISTSSWNRKTGGISLEKSDLPFFKEHRIEYDQKTGRMEIFRISDDRLTWSIPLQQVDKTNTSILPVRVDGHLLTIYHKGMLQCYSLPDQRLVWSRPISRHPSSAYNMNAVLKRPVIMQKARYAKSRFRVNRTVYKYGPLVALTSHTLCYFSKNDLVAVNPLDGEIRWIRRGIVRGSSVYGDEDHLFILPLNGTTCIVVNTNDGRVVETEDISPLISRGITISGNQMVLVDAKSANADLLGLKQGDIKISAVDLITRDTTWEFHVGNDDYIGIIDDNFLAIAKMNGQIQIVNIKTGEVEINSMLDKGKLKGVQEMVAIIDNDQVLLVINNSTSNRSYMSVPNQRVNGHLCSFDRHTGQLKWTRAVTGLNLAIQDINRVPVLFLGGRKTQRIHSVSINKFELILLDKQTGQPVYESSFTSQQTVQRMEWNTLKKQLRMHAYNSVYIISPKTKTEAKKPEK